MDAHDTVVLLDSDQDDGETAETGGARRSARRKRPRTGLDGGMLSSVVILDGVTAIVRPSQWTLLTLSELSRRASVKDGERLLLFFTSASHHALVAVESVASISTGSGLPSEHKCMNQIAPATLSTATSAW